MIHKLSISTLFCAVLASQSALAEGDKVPDTAGDLASALMKNKLNKANTREVDATEPAKSVEAESPVQAALNMAGMATLVAGLLFGASVYIRRRKKADGELETSATMKVVESMWLGRGQRLMLLSVRGHKVLIGASGGTLQNLAMLPPAPTRPNKSELPKVDEVAKDPDTKVEAQKADFKDLVKGELSNSAGVDLMDMSERPSRSSRPKRSPVRNNRNRILRQLNNL